MAARTNDISPRMRSLIGAPIALYATLRWFMDALAPKDYLLTHSRSVETGDPP
jgi:hypothetical protein